MRAAGIPDVTSYVFDHDAPSPWTGPVVRRDPNLVRQRSIHLTWLCQGRHCRRFTSNGAYLTGICNWCGERRPARISS